MATIRAYKLAEELGLDRTEFVEKAAALGHVLKSAMAPLDDAVANELREKLGARKRSGSVTERRVETGAAGGAAVIRRRKKAEEAAAPAPEPESVAVAPAYEPEPIESEPAPEPVVEEVESAEPEQPAIAARAQQTTQEAAAPATSSAGPRSRDMAQELGAQSDRGPAGPARPGRSQRKLVREVVNLREQERLARQATGRTVVRRPTGIDPRTATSPRRRRRDTAARSAPVPASAAKEASRRTLRIEGAIAVGELARLLGAKAPDVQRTLMSLGTMVSINQSIDIETARKVALQYDAEVQDVGFKEEAYFDEAAPEQTEGLVSRPPVVTVMGHVDHGKTSLLDAIRNANVVEGEAGGITQHIGAYQARVGDHVVTFIDTPGHAAFTEMRARGARVTDIVVLVVAATEGIMPQTVEAIEHAKAAEVPIVVAINKIDLPGANSAQTRQRLMEHNLVPEDFGGDVICVDVSATKGTGIPKLLEMIQLQAEVLELRADPSRRASGVVLEAQLDKGRGPVATLLVQQGTLSPGDMLVAGTAFGRVRAMEDERGRRLSSAGPSVPVQVQGLNSVPEAGELAHVVESERVAKEIISHRESQRRDTGADAAKPKRSLEEIFAAAEGGGVKELAVVLKADTRGSVEALRDALLKLSRDEVKVDVLLAGVGAVTESDVMLAKASGAVIVAFHVRPDPTARRAAEGQGVDVRTYQIIYEVTDDIKKAMEGLLPPTISETFGGRAEVRQTFSVPRIGTIAGSYVTEGNIRRGSQCRLIRDGVQIYDGKVGSLKRFKDDVREVASGFECGIGIDGYNDVKVGDVIETYALKEERASLE
ncbi:MAG TPA: translation initiation factor IF-2 [Myxococcota bacterium]|nr:translation initiation factor IF-2 [Myxococcota bacterium]